MAKTYNYNSSGTTTNQGDWDPAVVQLQQQLNAQGAQLAVDGKMGPLTEAALKQFGTPEQIQSPVAAYSSELPENTAGDSTAQLKATLTNYYGIPASIVNAASPQLLSFMGTVAQFNYQQATNGQTLQNINAGNIIDAYNQAASDPNIQSQFSDQLSIDKSNVVTQLTQLNAANTANHLANMANFLKQQQALAAQSEQGLTAGSGITNQAKTALRNEQQGVIQSTRAQAKQSLQQYGQGLESVYGTQGLGQFGPLNVGGMQYQQAGNIYGSEPVAQQTATINRANQIYGLLQYPGSQGSSSK